MCARENRGRHLVVRSGDLGSTLICMSMERKPLSLRIIRITLHYAAAVYDLMYT